MSLHAFHIGDRVRPRAGGDEMVIIAIVDNSDLSADYVCKWFEAGEIEHCPSYKGELLELVKKPRETIA